MSKKMTGMRNIRELGVGMTRKARNSEGESSTKRVPLRTCIGCRVTDLKRDLIRIVRSSNGVQVDQTGKQAGRGAYVHAQRECWDRALRGTQVSQALRIEIGPQDRHRLRGHAAVILGEEF